MTATLGDRDGVEVLAMALGFPELIAEAIAAGRKAGLTPEPAGPSDPLEREAVVETLPGLKDRLRDLTVDIYEATPNLWGPMVPRTDEVLEAIRGPWPKLTETALVQNWLAIYSAIKNWHEPHEETCGGEDQDLSHAMATVGQKTFKEVFGFSPPAAPAEPAAALFVCNVDEGFGLSCACPDGNPDTADGHDVQCPTHGHPVSNAEEGSPLPKEGPLPTAKKDDRGGAPPPPPEPQGGHCVVELIRGNDGSCVVSVYRDGLRGEGPTWVAATEDLCRNIRDSLGAFGRQADAFTRLVRYGNLREVLRVLTGEDFGPQAERKKEEDAV